jgi:hypothetical protein
MDPRERADAALARARARGAFVVTPESAISPMDTANTLQIPRSVVSALDHGDPESTMAVPAPLPSGRAVPAQALRPEAGRPAITQEASTQMLPTPSPTPRPAPGDRPRPAPDMDSHRRPMGWAPPVPPAPPTPEPVDGLVPTVKHPPTSRSSLSQRLDG